MEEELKKETLVIDDGSIIANVNTIEDLKVAEIMLQSRSAIPHG